ncbi:hypothetical protein LDENG_00171570 [Lucifuga dentata]|nr:hypothetical protein LDENG_00171570 [Lucifuga dentata]
MGHLLTTEGLLLDPEKVAAIQNMQTPTDVKSLQRFLGFVNYLAKFLPRLSDVCEPLQCLTDKDVEWAWLSVHDSALDTVLTDKDVEWAWLSVHDSALDTVKRLVTCHPVLQPESRGHAAM